MMLPVLETLFLPFHQGLFPWPSGRALFINAQAYADLNKFPMLEVIQYHKSQIDNLSYNALSDDAVGPDFCAVLCLLPKQTEEAKYALGQAYQALKRGGLLVAAAANDAGGKRLSGFFEDLGLSAQSLSKNKSRVTWAIKENESGMAREWIRDFGFQLVMNGTYLSRPGIFSWDREDHGSAFLIQNLPKNLKGIGADFGCGYGFISSAVLKNPEVKTLYCIDEDSRALECCRQNLKSKNAIFLWHDLARTKPDIPPLDWIVMNPPFHEGKNVQSGLGMAFIERAAQSLKPGGDLWMVANAHLPYESVLKSEFSSVKLCAQAGGFKVIYARK